MVYLREDLCKFKGDVKTAIYRWCTSMIDQLFAGKAGLEPVAYYAKNGISNAIDRYDEQLNRYIDYAVMFVSDKDGKIDTDKLIGDLVEIYRSTEKRTENLLGMKISFRRKPPSEIFSSRRTRRRCGFLRNELRLFCFLKTIKKGLTRKNHVSPLFLASCSQRLLQRLIHPPQRIGRQAAQIQA